MMFTLIHTLNQYIYIYIHFVFHNKQILYPYCMNKMVTVNRHLVRTKSWISLALTCSRWSRNSCLWAIKKCRGGKPWFSECSHKAPVIWFVQWNNILRNLQNTGYSCHNMPNVSGSKCTLFIIFVDLAVISKTSSLDTKSNRMHWVQILRLTFSPRWRQTALAGPCPAPGSALQWSCRVNLIQHSCAFPVITDTKAISLSANLWLSSKPAAGVMHRALAQ